MKKCSKCLNIKPEDQYHKDRSKKDGLGSCCKNCVKERQDLLKVSQKIIILSKKCSKCFKVKDSKEFGKDKYTKDGKSCRCKLCEKEYLKTLNPDKLKNTILKREYGISLDFYNYLQQKQNYCCILCTYIGFSKISNKKTLSVDHDHITGKVRGLLCTQHNTALGKLGDNEEKIKIVLLYLQGKL